MRILKIHGPVLLLMVALVFAAFGDFMRTPLWDAGDADILCEAHQLSQNPSLMFRHVGFYFSQPLLQLAFLAGYKVFGLDPAGYIMVNLLIHAFNAFIVYMLVHMLFPQLRLAILAAILFALGVGSYGRILMSIQQLEALSLAGLHLLVLYFFIRNDFRREGQIRSPLYLAGVLLFLISGLTKTASFSLILALVAYKAFFYKWRKGRAILSTDLLLFAALGLVFHLGQSLWGYRSPTVFDSAGQAETFTWMSFKNLFRYLNLMFFPLQQSPILENSNPVLIFIYEMRTVIRVFLTLSIISYSFFGFVFGSKAIRFFIAWTFITLLPFTGHSHTGQWLNLSHLYLTSLGFCVILAAGTTGSMSLLARAGWKRFTPLVVPLSFVAASLVLAHKLDTRHEEMARSERGQLIKEQMIKACTKRPTEIRTIQ